MIKIALAGLGVIALSACTSTGIWPTTSPSPKATTPPASAIPLNISDATRAMHEGFIVMDTHLDTPAEFGNDDYRFSDRQSVEGNGSNVDLPRMIDGGLDGGFWVIFTSQDKLDPATCRKARNGAILRQTRIRELAARYGDDVELAFNSEDAARIAADGKRIIYQSMENAYPLCYDLSLLESFYTQGLRMIGPVHFSNNQFADSSTDKAVVFNGLSTRGEALIREANRLGLILDGSHASDATVRDMIALSTTPIILSHTGVKVVFDHARNIDDDLLRELAASGGVIQINAYSGYLEDLPPKPERDAALEALETKYGTDDPDTLGTDKAAAMLAEYDAINKAHPRPRSTFKTFLEHLLHALEIVGPEHVGMGADWDGGGGVVGMEDVSYLPRVTEALLAAGYSEDDVSKFWSGNMLRLLKAAEAARTAHITSPDVLR